MKVALSIYDTGMTTLVPMVELPSSLTPTGYSDIVFAINERDDLIPADGEYLSISVAMSLYEGGEASGSYDGYSWAVIPENEREAAYLAEICSRPPIYRVAS